MRARWMVVASLLTIFSRDVRAQAVDWTGLVDARTRAPRPIETRGPGLYAITLDVPSVGPIALTGRSSGATLELRAVATSTPGAAPTLSGATTAPGSRPIVADVAARADGSFDARVLVAGREVASETWLRPSGPRIDIVSLAGDDGVPDAFDPKTAKRGLEVKFRISGGSTPVTLRLRPRAKDAIDFYHDGREVEPGVVVRAPLENGAALAPGDHSVTLDGRDPTPARRILLGGEWELELAGPTARATATFRVAAPPAIVIAPVFSYDKRDQRRVVETFESTLEEEGYRSRIRRETSVKDGLAELASKALVAYWGHGNASFMNFVDKTEESLHVSDLPPPKKDGPKPLADLRIVVIGSCRVARRPDGLLAEGKAWSWRWQSVPERLIDQGADVVIAFDDKILEGSGWIFYDQFGREAENGAPLPLAARLAAERSDAEMFEDVGVERAKKDAKRAREDPHADIVAPLSISLRLFRASNIDLAKETLVPPRWGDSRN